MRDDIRASNNDTSYYRLGYRPDIEGLRAVAILLVVAVHTRIPWLTGGYVGVDVFFVLSGYLITALLAQEISNSGDLGFASFYARRLRRLLPALLLMLLCTGLLGWLLLPYDTQFRQADAAGNAAFWLSNFFFGVSNLSYFGPGAKANLFLHTWSLGVEEQFYLLWPLLIVVAAGAWSNATKKPDISRLKWVMPIILVTSLALCIYWSDHAPQLAFYMMPARAWQFALGALVFMFFGIQPGGPGKAHGFKPNKHVARAAGWTGLLMVLGSAIFLNAKIIYPGAWALLPSFGAALIILAGTYRQPGSITRVLSTRPMQSIGRVSYSWYLWHWPVLLLGTSVFLVHSLWGRLGLALLSLMIASASYLFVEKPIRRQKKLVIKPQLTVFASLGIMALASLMALAWHRNVAMRVTSPPIARYARARWDSPGVYSMGCDSWYHSATVALCNDSPPHPRHIVVIMGDSITMQWFPAVKRIFQKKGWEITAITKSSCPMVDVPVFYAHIRGIYKVCSEWRAAALKQVAKIKPDILIFSSSYAYPFDKQQWIGGTRTILREMSPAVGQIYIIRPTPELPFSGPDCLEPRSAVYSWLKIRSSCTARIHSTRFKRVYHWLEIAAHGFPNVETVDMTRFICPHKLCHAALDGKIVFRDHEHLTATFARSLTPDLAHQLFGTRTRQNAGMPAMKAKTGS